MTAPPPYDDRLITCPECRSTFEAEDGSVVHMTAPPPEVTAVLAEVSEHHTPFNDQRHALHPVTCGCTYGPDRMDLPPMTWIEWHAHVAAEQANTLADLFAAERARGAEQAWDEGLRAGGDYERAKWYWQAGNRAAMAAAGFPVERPERPANPYRLAALPLPRSGSTRTW